MDQQRFALSLPATENWLGQANEAARRLGSHPQDHGWRNLYQLFSYGIEQRAPQFSGLVSACGAMASTGTATHAITLLGIALKEVDSASVSRLAGSGPLAERLELLEAVVAGAHAQLNHLVGHRRNSFTGARRFLVPQVLLSAYFSARPMPCDFADLGTGLGVLPRQLNSRTLFDRVVDDLPWRDGVPSFVEIPLRRRWGVDRGPMPAFDWVRACYGPSGYYDELFAELERDLAVPEVRDAPVDYQELDLLDGDAVAEFIRTNQINAVNISYVLYQWPPSTRDEVVDRLAGALHEPALIIVSEPNNELGRPGCRVLVRDDRSPGPRHVCTVSDGHFRGHVEAGPDWDEFVTAHPIAFRA
jgi:hypothetical protein